MTLEDIQKEANDRAFTIATMLRMEIKRESTVRLLLETIYDYGLFCLELGKVIRTVKEQEEFELIVGVSEK